MFFLNLFLFLMLYYNLFVYGTLKKGGNNASYLSDSEFLGQCYTADHQFDFTLRYAQNGQYVYPVLRYSGPNHIQGELYQVNKDTLYRIDALERVDVEYKRRVITLNNGKHAFCYFGMEHNESDIEHTHKDWKDKITTSNIATGNDILIFNV